MSDKEVREPRVYELGYHFLPTVPEADLEKETDKIKDALHDLGGLEFKEEKPKLIDLAYPMFKVLENKRTQFTQGYFGWIKFDISPEQLVELKKKLDANLNILRYITISTTREDTFIVDKRAMEKKHERAPKPEIKSAEELPVAQPIEDAGEVNEEELNKQIDEMVAEE